jgi:hypothetical protein
MPNSIVNLEQACREIASLPSFQNFIAVYQESIMAKAKKGVVPPQFKKTVKKAKGAAAPKSKGKGC